MCFPEGKSEDKMTEILQIADDVRALVDESGKKFEDVCLDLGNGCFNSGQGRRRIPGMNWILGVLAVEQGRVNQVLGSLTTISDTTPHLGFENSAPPIPMVNPNNLTEMGHDWDPCLGTPSVTNSQFPISPRPKWVSKLRRSAQILWNHCTVQQRPDADSDVALRCTVGNDAFEEWQFPFFTANLKKPILFLVLETSIQVQCKVKQIFWKQSTRPLLVLKMFQNIVILKMGWLIIMISLYWYIKLFWLWIHSFIHLSHLFTYRFIHLCLVYLSAIRCPWILR